MGACLHSLVFSLVVTLKLVSACLDGKRSVFLIISETFFYIYIYSPLIRVFDDIDLENVTQKRKLLTV